MKMVFVLAILLFEVSCGSKSFNGFFATPSGNSNIKPIEIQDEPNNAKENEDIGRGGKGITFGNGQTTTIDKDGNEVILYLTVEETSNRSLRCRVSIGNRNSKLRDVGITWSISNNGSEIDSASYHVLEPSDDSWNAEIVFLDAYEVSIASLEVTANVIAIPNVDSSVMVRTTNTLVFTELAKIEEDPILDKTDNSTAIDSQISPEAPVQPPVVEYHASCLEHKTGTGENSDGSYQLYIGNDENKPWTAYCYGMNTDEPKEYLSLIEGVDKNYSQFTAANVIGTDVRTIYTRIRIDPQTLIIQGGDQIFSSSSGSITQGEVIVTSMPYGVAMTCSTGIEGVANIDLSNTPFAIDSTFTAVGAGSSVETTPDVNNQVLDISALGGCGWSNATYIWNPRNTANHLINLRYDASLLNTQN